MTVLTMTVLTMVVLTNGGVDNDGIDDGGVDDGGVDNGGVDDDGVDDGTLCRMGQGLPGKGRGLLLWVLTPGPPGCREDCTWCEDPTVLLTSSGSAVERQVDL
ncbi:hypothetical protein NN561_019882 [Cricetulus griseus]